LFGTPLSDIKAKKMTAANMMHPTSTPDKSLYIMQKGYNDAEHCGLFWSSIYLIVISFPSTHKGRECLEEGVLNETYPFDLLTVAL
jgi:hypothetical protein